MWKQIIGPTLLVSLLWVAVGGSTNYYIKWLHESQERTMATHLATVHSTNQLLETLSKLEAVVFKATEQNGKFGTEAQAQQVTFEQTLNQIEDATSTSEGVELVKNIRREFSAYADSVHLWLEPKDESFGRPTSQDMAERANAVRGPSKRLVEMNQQRMVDSNESYVRLSRLASSLQIFFFTVGPAIGLFLGVRVALRLRSSILRLSTKLQDATQELQPKRTEDAPPPSGELPALEHQVQEVSGHVGRMVQELELVRRYAAQSERLAAVGELAAGVAHELRNPLTSIKLLVQNAARKNRDRPLTDRQLQVLQEEIARMENSIQGLLDFARPSQAHHVPHNLSDTIRRAVNLVKPRAVELGVTVGGSLPRAAVMVKGDPEQLHQVFINLLLNALEAMPDGGKLRIVLREDREANASFLEIRNTGAGIPQALLDRLFEPFVSGQEQGYGLGLSISRRIVEAHGGTISAANRSEGGTVFTVFLPLEHKPTWPDPSSDTDIEGLTDNCGLQLNDQGKLVDV